jgi:hypothetical protein
MKAEACLQYDLENLTLNANWQSEAKSGDRALVGAAPTVSNAIDYAKFYSRSHDALIRVYDAAGTLIETEQHAGEFKGGGFLLT